MKKPDGAQISIRTSLSLYQRLARVVPIFGQLYEPELSMLSSLNGRGTISVASVARWALERGLREIEGDARDAGIALEET